MTRRLVTTKARLAHAAVVTAATDVVGEMPRRRLPALFGFGPAKQSEWQDLLTALRRAVDTELTPRQREIVSGRS